MQLKHWVDRAHKGIDAETAEARRTRNDVLVSSEDTKEATETAVCTILASSILLKRGDWDDEQTSGELGGGANVRHGVHVVASKSGYLVANQKGHVLVDCHGTRLDFWDTFPKNFV